jgi:hypothetical protein
MVGAHERRAADRQIRAAIDAIDGAAAVLGKVSRARRPARTTRAAAPAPGAAGPGAAGAARTDLAGQPLLPPHEVDDMLAQRVFYPAHKKRTESAAYRQARRQFVEVQDRGCLVCGVRRSTLKKPADNPFGATQIETHHRIVEWALSNAVDLAKFNARIVGSFRRHDPKNAKYAADFSQAQMLDWIDHDPDNLWVLCDVHHRHKYVGIHAVSGPIWGPQDLLMTGFGPQMAAASTPADAHH